MSGTFDLSFEGDKFSPIHDIPANISSKDLSFLLENHNGIGQVFHAKYGICTGLSFVVCCFLEGCITLQKLYNIIVLVLITLFFLQVI